MPYPQQYVAFLDLLGFTEFVKNSTYEEIRKIFIVAKEDIDFVKDSTQKYNPDKDGVHVYQFSDSVVMLYPEGRGMDLIIDFLYFQASLGQYGWFFRGGICYGDVDSVASKDKSMHVFGPAYLNAYELESKVAKEYNIPAVIMDEKTYVEICKEGNPKDIKECLKYDAKSKHYYVDIFSHDYLLYGHLASTREKIIGGVNKYARNPNVCEKYIWLAEHFNKAVPYINKKLCKLKKQNGKYFAALKFLSEIKL